MTRLKEALETIQAGMTVTVSSADGEREHEYGTTVKRAYDRRATPVEPEETPCVIFGEGECEIGYPGRDHEVATHRLQVVIECLVVGSGDQETDSAAPLLRVMMNDVCALMNSEKREFLRLGGAVQSIRRVSDMLETENNQLLAAGRLLYEFSYLTPDDLL
jgi:hypothetical protein